VIVVLKMLCNVCSVRRTGFPRSHKLGFTSTTTTTITTKATQTPDQNKHSSSKSQPKPETINEKKVSQWQISKIPHSGVYSCAPGSKHGTERSFLEE
jgi:hypothetical protein